MKKTLLSIFSLITALCARTQILYGTSFNGGADGGGTINRFIPALQDLTIPENLESFAANPISANLIQASNGNLYGMTSNGGSKGYGVIFSFDPLTSAYAKLKDFDGINGANPSGSLIQASDGKLYGVTTYGGSGYGVLFSFDPFAQTYTKLRDFDPADGSFPSGNLVQAMDGKLYGMTSGGSSSDEGVIFSFDPSSLTYAKLKDFNDMDGARPYGSLIQASDGKLYGMTTFGGSGNAGVIFSFDHSSGAYAKLEDFDGTTSGGYPLGSLVQADDGRFYGMTTFGGSGDGGVIFSYDPVSGFTRLRDFDDSGYWPHGNLIQAVDGKLYGTTAQGGTSNVGVIFSFDPSLLSFAKLEDFNNTNGSIPVSSLLEAGDGKLYGLTSSGGGGGISSPGVLFSFDPTTFTYSLLKEFGANENGSNISSGLMRASDGKLYGLSTNGGSRSAGVIFSFDAASSTYTKLKDFDYVNGSHPYGSLLQASDGKLYGLTYYGGLDDINADHDLGTIFSFDLASSTYTRLIRFDNYTSHTGSSPFGSLIQLTDGKLYGMTSGGGGGYRGQGAGVIFSFDPTVATYSRLKDFANFDSDLLVADVLDGSSPYGSLLQAGDGILYGMTSLGGNNDFGVLFSYDPVPATYTKLMDFDNTNGSYPYGSLIHARDGKLYGMTYGGGSNDAGVIFSYDPSSSIYTRLHDFDYTNGSHPYGNLMQASDGKLYGMTSDGGMNDYGVIFSFDPVTSLFTKLVDYNGDNGAIPYLGSAFIELPESIPLPIILTNFYGINKSGTNELSWNVENDQNVNYYELQRSSDGHIFRDISQIKAEGKPGYSYYDNIAAARYVIYFYRLKIVDKDGNFTYSAVVKLKTNLHGILVAASPNPFKNMLIITVESAIPDKVHLVLTDMNGRELLRKHWQLVTGTNLVQLPETAILAKGTYVLAISDSKQTQSVKVIKAN